MNISKLTTLWLLSNFFGISFLFAQSCPENIGFENGDFNKWQTFIGSVANVNGNNVITVIAKAQTKDRHTIMSSKTANDLYGKFPVLAPNNSGHSVKLGNDGTGGQAERISYLITVPPNNADFNLTYQYAVVFEDPSHSHYEQPRFTAKVLDLSTNTYISCASFDYIATSSLPGFKKSSQRAGVMYKNWTPVSINLSGYQGKQLLLEFTTADCTLGGHFGYAYIDVNENCENIIEGNTYCEGAKEVTLKGPGGYEFYKWYNADRSVKYGEGETITLKPALLPGEKVFLDLIPFSGFGCPNTVSTIISRNSFEFKVVDSINACKNDIIDLTSNRYIPNKSLDVNYQYYSDAVLSNPIPDPAKITASGIYFIKTTSLSGCSGVKQIKIVFFDDTGLDVISDIKVCADTKIDLTVKSIQKFVPIGLTITYFSDLALTKPVPDPKNVTLSGDYYLKFSSQFCFTVKKVSVEIYKAPVLNIINPKPVCTPATVDITNEKVTVGSDLGISLSYYADLNLTTTLANPNAIDKAGSYFIKAVNEKGCVTVKQVFVEIYELPILQVIKSVDVCYPNTVDLTDNQLYVGTTVGVDYSFYEASTGQKVTNPKSISKAGNYKVTINNANGCEVSKEIKVIINPQPVLIINQPKKMLISQIFDLTANSVIAGSSGYNKITYWQDSQMNQLLSDPENINQTGVYYIALTNSFGCRMVGKVNVIFVPYPKIIVPTAFTPFKNTNNKLYPFLEGIEELKTFKIFNKWGNLVFESSSMNPIEGWNGTYKGDMQPFETFSWYAEGINLLGQVFITKGKTVLIP